MKDEIWTGATTALLRQSIEDDGTRRQLASEALAAIITPAALAGTVNNYAPAGGNQARVWRLISSGGARSITGIDIAQWPVASRSGLVLELYNISSAGADAITLEYQDGGSLAANRFRYNNGNDFVLEADGHCTVWYDLSSACFRISS